MSIDIEQNNRDPRGSKTLAGILLLMVGVIFLIQHLNFFFFPYWIFSWPMILIIFGLYTGVKHNFRNSAWCITVTVGVLFLINEIFPYVNVWHNFWPLVIIVIGIKMILSRNRPWDKERWKKEWHWKAYVDPKNPDPGDPAAGYKRYNPFDPTKDAAYSDDHLNAVSIFGGTNKTILSKNFQGGDIVNIFGGSEIDFSQSDIAGRVIVEITQVFGGVKLIVPPHWHVTSDMVAVFAGFDDKRRMKSDLGTDKILILRGTSIFAGIEIRSF